MAAVRERIWRLADTPPKVEREFPRRQTKQPKGSTEMYVRVQLGKRQLASHRG